MGKDVKEDSGFGFKDKAKAVETLRLLEEHEPNYRRLTVRGLLGRAKRTLTMTKAADKKKNISEAIEVFENWLVELDGDKEGKSAKKPSKKEDKKEKASSEEKDSGDNNSTRDVEMIDLHRTPVNKVPNLGFKDKEAVEATFKELEGRDPEYQKFAIKGLIGSAKRVLTCTRDETKLANIKESIAKFEKFLEDYETNHLSKQNNAYLSLGVVNTALKMAGDNVTEQQKAFIFAYSDIKGDYKLLRVYHEKLGGKTWDVIRNAALKELKEKHANAKLFNDNKEPTAEHLQFLLWAYSPEPAQVKKLIPEAEEEKKEAEKNNDRSSRKRKSSTHDESSSKKAKE